MVFEDVTLILSEGEVAEFARWEPRIRCELIADGHHVFPTPLRMACQAKGASGICHVTDASPGTGLRDGSSFRFAGQECIHQG